MKKLLGILIVATTLISSTFAFSLSVGGRGLVGGRLDTIKNAGQDNGAGLSLGGGVNAHLELFGGLGAQAEANFVVNKLPAGNITLIDLPVMGWYQLDLFKDTIAIGFGIGPNFSNIFTDFSSLVKNMPGSTPNDVAAVDGKQTWNTGLAIGANFKIFFGEKRHFGVVLGANAVFDFTSNEFFNALAAENKTNAFFGDSEDGKRKEIYGTIGIEWRFF